MANKKAWPIRKNMANMANKKNMPDIKAQALWSVDHVRVIETKNGPTYPAS